MLISGLLDLSIHRFISAQLFPVDTQRGGSSVGCRGEIPHHLTLVTRQSFNSQHEFGTLLETVHRLSPAAGRGHWSAHWPARSSVQALCNRFPSARRPEREYSLRENPL